MTGNEFENIIRELLFTDHLTPHFKDNFFEIRQIIILWGDHMKDVIIP